MTPETDVKHIDKYVGSRLRQQRQLMGLSQSELGSHIHITFQQIQKYETGANRVSAGKLYQLANLLGVEISYFFEGIEESSMQEGVHSQKKLDLKLLGQVQSIKNEELKKKIISLIQSCAD